MLESSFQRLGGLSSKHSGKVLIIWIIIVVVMLPFASTLFSQTSYNLASDIVPSSSMSSHAASLMSDYFGQGNSSSSNGENSSSLIMVNTNLNIYSQPAILSMINAQAGTASYIKSLGGNASFISFISTENSSLLALAGVAGNLIKLAYPLIQDLYYGTLAVNGTGQEYASSVFGLPEQYIFEGHNLDAYQQTMHSAESIQSISLPIPASFQPIMGNTSFPAVSYFKNFASYYNNSNNEPDLAIEQALSNSSLLQGHNAYEVLNQSFSLSGITLSQYESQSSVYNASYIDTIKGASSILLSPVINSNSTVKSDVLSILHIKPVNMINTTVNATLVSRLSPVSDVSDSVVSGAIFYDYNGSPLQRIQQSNLPRFVGLVNSSKDVNSTVFGVLSQDNFSQYPVVPSQYLLHELVGYDNSTQITEIQTDVNLSVKNVQAIESIYQNSSSGIHGVSSYAAGTSALTSQLGSETTSGLVEALGIGIVISIFIVGIYFRSFYAAFLPFLMFLVSALTSISIDGILYKYIIRSSVSFITPTLLLILLLGLTSDYVVYIMSRYRREYRKGNPDAGSESAKWAGHAVFTSGITVSLSYVALWLSGVPLFSDAGISNAIGVLVAVLVANTLLIAILTRSGKRIFGHSGQTPESKYFNKVSTLVARNRIKIFGIFVAATLVGGFVYFITPTNMDLYSLVPASTGIQALEVVNSSFHGDFFDRGYVILNFSQPVISNGSYNTHDMNVISSVEESLINTTGISEVFGPTFPYGSYVSANLSGVNASFASSYRTQMDTFIGSDSHYAVVDFQLSNVAWGSISSKVVSGLNDLVSRGTGSQSDYYIGGLTEGLNNAYTSTSTSFTELVPVLSIAIFAVLLIQLGSVFTPIRLIIMVLASVIMSLSIAYIALFYILHLSILIFLPMFTVITLLAVGLDYDIFMITRVREEVMKGNTDSEGIAKSIKENGGVIVTLGSLLFATFGALVFSQLAIMQEIGAGLALGVLVDTFISWPFFVPSVMLILKRYNWWPSKIGRKQ